MVFSPIPARVYGTGTSEASASCGCLARRRGRALFVVRAFRVRGHRGFFLFGPGFRGRGDLELAELRLDLAALLLLALDVDPPAGELGRQPDILALLADGERELLVLDNHF